MDGWNDGRVGQLSPPCALTVCMLRSFSLSFSLSLGRVLSTSEVGDAGHLLRVQGACHDLRVLAAARHLSRAQRRERGAALHVRRGTLPEQI